MDVEGYGRGFMSGTNLWRRGKQNNINEGPPLLDLTYRLEKEKHGNVSKVSRSEAE
jgi:hypothetical protein